MDEQLIDQTILSIRSGNINDYSIIVKQYQKSLYQYIRYLSSGQCEVEDLLQEVFIKAYEHLDQYKLGTSFKNWIYRIAYNHTMTMLKKKNKHHVLLLGKLPEHIESKRTQETLSCGTRNALLKLTLEERNLIYLRVYEVMSYKKISQIHHLSESVLRKKFERAKKKFIKFYEKEENNIEDRRDETSDIKLCK